jgi:DNA-binding NarL/FixJ family response regulator
MNGTDATHQLKREMPEIQVIILTMCDLEEYRKATAATWSRDPWSTHCWRREQCYAVPV